MYAREYAVKHDTSIMNSLIRSAQTRTGCDTYRSRVPFLNSEHLNNVSTFINALIHDVDSYDTPSFVRATPAYYQFIQGMCTDRTSTELARNFIYKYFFDLKHFPADRTLFNAVFVNITNRAQWVNVVNTVTDFCNDPAAALDIADMTLDMIGYESDTLNKYGNPKFVQRGSNSFDGKSFDYLIIDIPHDIGASTADDCAVELPAHKYVVFTTLWRTELNAMYYNICVKHFVEQMFHKVDEQGNETFVNPYYKSTTTAKEIIEACENMRAFMYNHTLAYLAGQFSLPDDPFNTQCETIDAAYNDIWSAIKEMAEKQKLLEAVTNLKDVKVPASLNALKESLRDWRRKRTDYESRISTCCSNIRVLTQRILNGEAEAGSLETLTKLLQNMVEKGRIACINSDISDGLIHRLTLTLDTPITYWEDDEAKAYVRYLKSDGHTYKARLWEMMFVDKSATMWTRQDVYFNFDNTNVNNNGCTDSGYVEKYVIHPHVGRYNCFGDNLSFISDALSEKDYETAFTYVMNALMQLNMLDYTVMEYACNELCGTATATTDRKFIYLHKEQRFVTPQELKELYRDHDASFDFLKEQEVTDNASN